MIILLSICSRCSQGVRQAERRRSGELKPPKSRPNPFVAASPRALRAAFDARGWGGPKKCGAKWGMAVTRHAGERLRRNGAHGPCSSPPCIVNPPPLPPIHIRQSCSKDKTPALSRLDPRPAAESNRVAASVRDEFLPVGNAGCRGGKPSPTDRRCGYSCFATKILQYVHRYIL